MQPPKGCSCSASTTTAWRRSTSGFPTRREAEAELGRILRDEPGWAPVADGVYELEDLHPPPSGVELFGGPLVARPTVIRAATLREALGITQPRRHGRLHEAREILDAHLAAVADLGRDASLVGCFDDERDEHEDRVAIADAIERARARRYMGLIDSEEWERREALDYITDYTEIHDDEREVPQECPVCGLPALVPSGYDSYREQIAWGTCAACSYTKEFEVADLEGRDEELDGRLADPNS